MPEERRNFLEEPRPYEEWRAEIASYEPGNEPDPASNVQEGIEDKLTVFALPILRSVRRVAELKGEHALWGRVQEESADQRVKEFAQAQRVQLIGELRAARQELADTRINEEEASTALMVLQDITKHDAGIIE
jgi:hypothetical protein